MFHFKLIVREILHAKQHAVIFVLCVILAISTLVAVNGFSDSVNTALMRDARELNAADIIVESRQPFSASLTKTVDELDGQGLIKTSVFYEFYSVVRNEGDRASLLSSIKVVDKRYPFYGRCETVTGRALAQVLEPGTVVVEESLLQRLGLQPGERLSIGRATLTIADVLLKEPDRPVSFFRFGPRVFVAADDIEKLDLLGKGSRIRYVLLVKVFDENSLNRLLTEIRSASDGIQERVNSYRTANSRLERFLDNLIFFLALISILTLFLSGVGIHSTLTAYIRGKYTSIAVMKAIGAGSRFIVRQHSIGILLLGLIGTILGLVVGVGLEKVLPVFLSGIIPEQMGTRLSWEAMLEGALLGLVVVLLFAFLPLNAMKNIKPAFIFRKEPMRGRRGAAHYLSIAGIAALFIATVLWQLDDARTGLYFIGGVLGFLLMVSVFVSFLVIGLGRLHPRSLVVKQALKGLFRPGNATRAVAVTLTASLTVVFSIYLVERNLDQAYVKSYPPNSPNLFFLDIQTDQIEAFKRTLKLKTRYFPIVRARILSINDEKIDRQRERQHLHGVSPFT